MCHHHGMPRTAHRDRVLKEAWIGDAVLCLFARLKILREDGALDGDKADRLTSNRFLGIFAEPSETEARIGRIYEAEGLDAAFRWIEEQLVPAFELQESKRKARASAPNIRGKEQHAGQDDTNGAGE
jgi:hypothetical protein